MQKLHAYFDTFVVKSRNEAHTRVGGVQVDISQEDSENPEPPTQSSKGTSEIVVEENSVQDLLSKFKNQETGPVSPKAPIAEKKNENAQNIEHVEQTENINIPVQEPETIHVAPQRKASK